MKIQSLATHHYVSGEVSKVSESTRYSSGKREEIVQKKRHHNAHMVQSKCPQAFKFNSELHHFILPLV